jgi:hypothetical protein
MTQKPIILAPHVDDEVIGCYQPLTNNEIDEVWYLNEVTPERKEEALSSAKVFKFTPVFDKEIKADNFTEGDKVYVTSSFDLHDDHRKANREAKLAQHKVNFDLWFYSIDMNRKPKPANPRKKHVVNLFPTQAALFQNEKYVLFEDIHHSDTIEMYTFKWGAVESFEVTVTLTDQEFTLNGVTQALTDKPSDIALKLSEIYPNTEVEINLGQRTWKYKI